MAVETVFLFVLVIALVIGNVLLSLIPSNKRENNNSEESSLYQTDFFEEEKNSFPKKVAQSGEEAAQASVLFSNFNALNQKINLTGKQMDSINQKLQKLDNFRANTAVELKALKEIIVELQNKYLTASSKKIKNSPKLTGKQMHKIIYRSKQS